MAEHERVNKGKQKDLEQKHRTRQQQSQPSSDAFHAWDDGQSALLETPFIPRIEEHVAILSRIPFSVQRHEFIMRLHKTYGNRYVQRLMESMNVQAKLNISDPNDVHEQEADRVADAVTKAIQTQVNRQEEEEELQMQSQEEEEEILQGKSIVQRQEEEEEFLQSKSLIQQQQKNERAQASHTQYREASEEVKTEVAPKHIQRMTPFNPEKDKIIGEDEEIGGYAIQVHTDAGTPVLGWASDEVIETIVPPEKLKEKSVVAGQKLPGEEFGLSFFCHGFSLGTFGKFGYSVYGNFIQYVLNDEYNYIGDLASARDLKRGDICVIGPLEMPAHSCVIAEDKEGNVDPDTLLTDSKDIFGAVQKGFPLRYHMNQYKTYPQITFFRKK